MIAADRRWPVDASRKRNERADGKGQPERPGFSEGERPGLTGVPDDALLLAEFVNLLASQDISPFAKLLELFEVTLLKDIQALVNELIDQRELMGIHHGHFARANNGPHGFSKGRRVHLLGHLLREHRSHCGPQFTPEGRLVLVHLFLSETRDVSNHLLCMSVENASVNAVRKLGGSLARTCSSAGSIAVELATTRALTLLCWGGSKRTQEFRHNVSLQ